MATWNSRNNSNIGRQPNQLSTFGRYIAYRDEDEEKRRIRTVNGNALDPADADPVKVDAAMNAAAKGANQPKPSNVDDAWENYKQNAENQKQKHTDAVNKANSKVDDAWKEYKQNVEDQKQKHNDAMALNYLEKKKHGETEPQKKAQKELENLNEDTFNLVKGWANGGYNKTNVNEEQLADMGGNLTYEKLDELANAYNKKYLEEDELYAYMELKIKGLNDDEKKLVEEYDEETKAYFEELYNPIGIYKNKTPLDEGFVKGQVKAATERLKNKLKKLGQNKWTDEKLTEYADYIERVADKRNTDYVNKLNYGEAGKVSKMQGIFNSLDSLDLEKVLSGGIEAVFDFNDDPNGIGDNMYTAGKYKENSKNYARDVTAQTIAQNHPYLAKAYSIGMSAAESAETVLVGGGVGNLFGAGTKIAQIASEVATLTPFAASAYNSTYKNAISRGLSPEDAQKEGFFAAVIEAGTEKLPLENFLKFSGKAGKLTAKKYALEWLKESGLEGLEEVIGDVANRIVDYAVADGTGLSEMEIATQQYIDQGYSEEEAKSMAEKDFWLGVAEDFGAGAASGSLLTGATLLSSSNRSQRAYAKYSEDIENKNKKVAENSTDTEYGRSSKEMAERFAQNPTAYIAENIDDSTPEGKQQKEFLQKYADKVDSGRKLTRNDKMNIVEVLQDTKQAPVNMDNFFVPDEYKAATTNMSVEEGRKAIQDAIKAKDQDALSKAYRDMANSTSVAARNGAKEAMEQFTGMAQNAGLDVKSAMVGTQEAYMKGLRGETFQSSDENLMRAFTYGELKRANETKTRTINSVNDLKTNVETSSGVKMVLGTFNSDGEIITNKGTIKADDIIEDTAVRKAYQYASQKENIIASNLFMRNIKDGENIDTYNAAFNSMYRAGSTGVSFEQATKEGFLATQANHIGLDRAKVFWELGNNEHISEIKKTNDEAISKILGVKEFGSGVVLDNRTDKADTSNLKMLNMLAKFANKTNIALCDDDSAIFMNGENAFFDANNSTIYLKNGNLKAVFHELAEFTDFYNSEGFEKLRQSAIEWMTRDLGNDKFNFYLQGYKDLYSDEGHSYFDASKEMVNDYIVAVLKSGKGSRVLAERLAQKMGTKEARTFGQKLKNWIAKVKAAIQKLFSDSQEMTSFMKEVNASIQNAEDVVNAFVDALEGAVEIQEAAFTGNLTMDKAIEDGTAVKDGDTIRMSKETFNNGGRETLAKFLAEESGLTQKDQTDIMDTMEEAYNLVNELMEDTSLTVFDEWQKTGLLISDNGTPLLRVYRADGKPTVSVIVNNGEYPLNIDFSQVCKKRVALNEVLIKLIEDVNFNMEVLTETDIAEMNRLIKKHNFEIACGLCFVDSKRYRVDGWASSFTEGVYDQKTKQQTKEGWNDLVASMLTKDVSAEYFALSSEHTKPLGNLLHEMSDENIDFSHLDEIIKPYLKEDGSIGQVEIDGEKSNPGEIVKMAYLLRNNKNMRKFLDHQDLINSKSLDDLRVKFNPVYTLVNAHGGTSKPKLSHGFVPYGNDILESRNWNVSAADFNAKNAYKVGGVRVQSFSDFVANMFFDYMQMFADMSARQLPSHAYTKELAYAKLFGMTGQRINMSLIFKGANLNEEQQARYNSLVLTKNGNQRKNAVSKLRNDPMFSALMEHAGLDENGNYIFEDESFDYNEAVALQNDPNYKYCGTIGVGLSDAHIRKMLNDDNIKMVIPYHASGVSQIIKIARNLSLYTDYTNVQNTRGADGKKLEKGDGFDWYGKLKSDANPNGVEAKELAQMYLDYCDEKGYIPKFDQFRNEENYYKLLIDFRAYDNDGNFMPQGAVKMNMPSNIKEIILPELKKQQAEADRLVNEMKEGQDTLYTEIKNNLRERGTLIDNEVRKSKEMNSSYVMSSTGKQISPEFANVLDRLDSKESVSIEEIRSIPEVIDAYKRLGDGVETVNLPGRESMHNGWIDTLIKQKGFADTKKVLYNGDARKGFRADFVLGLPASGKSSVISNELIINNKAFLLDNDETKKLIPEYNDGWGAGIVHEESGDVSNKLSLRFIDENSSLYGTNLVIPTVGSKNTASKIEMYKNAGYDVHLHYVDVAQETSLSRMLKRFITDNRFLDPNLVYKFGKTPLEVYEQLKSEVESYEKWSNEVGRNEKARLIESSSSEETRRDLGQNRKEGSRIFEEDTRTTAEEIGIRKSKEMSASFDSEGNTITEQQAEYFKDSKVVDENGKLKVMYHGTKSEFTVFNPFISGGVNGTAEGYGLYFADTDEVSKAYGDNQLKGYLNIKNPASSKELTIKQRDLAKLIKETINKEAQSFVDEGSYDNVADALRDTWISNYTYTYDKSIDASVNEVAKSILQMSGSDMEIIQKVMGGLAIRNYESAYNFYDILGKTLGIDGFVTEWTEGDKTHEIALAFYSNQFKNIDNTNPTENEDIRYSLEMDSAFEYVLDWEEVNEYASILEEGAKEAQALDEKVVKGIADKIRNEVGSNYDAALLTENLQKAFNYMATNAFVSYSDMMRVFKEIATPVVEEANAKVGEEEYRRFVNAMKGYRIALTDSQIKSVKKIFGSYVEYKRQMSPINIVKDGSTLEHVWNEIVEASDFIIDRDVASSEMPTVLYDTLQAMKPAPRSTYGGNVEDVSKDVAMRIVEEYLIAQNNVELAEEIQNRKKEVEKRLKEEYREKLKNAKQSVIENKARAIADKAIRENDRVNREQNLARIAEIKARYKGEAQRKSEKAEADNQKRQIEGSVKRLTNWIQKPSEKHHVPVSMVDPILDFTKALDFVMPDIRKTDWVAGTWSMRVFDHSETDSNGRRKPVYKTLEGKSRNEVVLKYYDMLNEGRGSANARGWKQRMQKIVDMYNQRNLDDSNANEVSELLDASLAEELKEVMQNKTASINNLTSNELKTINKVLKNIENAINKQNKMFSASHDISEIAKNTMDFADNTKVNMAKTRRREKIWGTLFFNMATPDTFMHGLGDGAEKVYKSIRKGFNTFINDIKTAQDFMQETMDGVKKKDIKKWNKDVLHLDLPSGHTDITIAQIMSLYELNKRNQALSHYRGGVTVEEFNVGNKKFNKDAKPLHLKEADLNQLFSYLTPQQIEIAESLQRYMATVCAEQGNEVAREMYGFEKFTEDRYFPITTNKDFISANDSNTSPEGFTKIERSGFTKALVEDASNPIIVKNIFDVFTDHVSQMASYHGYAPALKDAMRWYNYKETSPIEGTSDANYSSVMESIKKVYGNNGKSYFTKFIKDINQVDKSQYIGNFTDKLIGGYKASAVGGNMRVVVQQPTAYVRAANLINPIYLTEAMLPNNIAKYSKWMSDSEIAQWKSWGYYETSIGKSLKEIVTGQNSFKDKFTNAVMAPAGVADDLTWRVLYTATALEQKAKNKGLSESELREKIKERFDEMVDQTQVVDSTIHRSQYMRSKDTLNKLQTAFMAEPTKSYNMILRALMDDYKNGGIPKKTLRATTTFAVTSLATAAAAALVDGLRRTGDDDDYEEVYLEALQEGFIDNVNPFNLMPVIKDVSSSVYNMITGESSFGNSSARMDLDAISSLVDAVNATYKYIEGDSNKTVYGLVNTIVRPLSQMTGVPAYNLQRDLVSIYNQFGEDLAKTIKTPNAKYLPIYNSIAKDDDIEVIKEKIDKAMEQEGTIYDVRKGISSRYKSDYYGALLVDEEEARAIADLARKGLMATGMTEKEANDTILGWEEDSYGYAEIDKAIQSGEGIYEAMAHLIEGKKPENIVKHFITRYEDTFKYNNENAIDSQVDENVEEALSYIGKSYSSAKKAYDELQAEKQAKAEAKEAKAEAKEKFYNVIQSGNGDYKSAIEDMVEAGTDYKTIKSNLSSDQTKPLIKAYYNGDKNAYKAIQRIVTIRAYLSKQMGTKIAKKYHGDYLKYENDQVKKLMAEYEKNPW